MAVRLRGAFGIFLGLFLAGCAVHEGGSYAPGGWQLLGEREADFRQDRDRIEVGRREGAFKQIRVSVRGAPLEMSGMVVTFADGKTFSPNLRAHFDENSSSREIDLPGERRSIRSVDFNYRSANRREGKATVMLYAR